jgi:DNA-binding NarL/FixJ family response regulator
MASHPNTESRLDDDQLAILRLVALGFTDDRISRQLGLSRSGVQRRLRRAAGDFGCSSRLTLVLSAIERGFIELPQSPCREREANSSPEQPGTATESTN